jgi:hypothetical protein
MQLIKTKYTQAKSKTEHSRETKPNDVTNSRLFGRGPVDVGCAGLICWQSKIPVLFGIIVAALPLTNSAAKGQLRYWYRQAWRGALAEIRGVEPKNRLCNKQLTPLNHGWLVFSVLAI